MIGTETGIARTADGKVTRMLAAIDETSRKRAGAAHLNQVITHILVHRREMDRLVNLAL